MSRVGMCGLLICACVGGCVDEFDEDTEDYQLDEVDVSAADALYEAIDGYWAWDQHPIWQGVELSLDGAHGDYVQIWLNDAAMTMVDSTQPVNGAILVKEGYADADATVSISLTVMEWLGGESSEKTGWFWASYAPDSGAVLEAGQPKACVSCHQFSDGDDDDIVFDDQ